MTERIILVTGATGAQGGATVDALLGTGFRVRALVRDRLAPSPRALAERGVELCEGDFDDRASVITAANGTWGVFSVQLPPTPSDPDCEIRAACHLIEAAREAGVEVFVHTSVARAGDQTRFVDWESGRWWPDYWNAKSGVNDAVRQAGFPRRVILKPAFMMDNFMPPKAAYLFPGLARGAIETAMKPDTRLDLIAAADIGRFAAAAFADPARFDRQEIDLAAESLTMAQVAEILSEVSGTPVVARSMRGADARAAGVMPGLVESQQWANVEGYKVDIDRAHGHGIALERFGDWAARHRDRLRIGAG